MMSDDPSEKLNFGFETSGENNDLAFGLMYDFSNGITNGKVRINVKAAPLVQALSDLDLNLALSEHNSEYSGKIQFNLTGAELVSAETTFKSGQATALIKTPVPDYESILIELESDFSSKAVLLFELNGVATSIAAMLESQDHFKLIIKTPVVGYELVTANYDLLSNGSRRIIIERSGVRITNLLITTDLKPNGGKIDIDLTTNAKNLWWKLTAEYLDGKGLFHYRTAVPEPLNLKVEFEIKQGDPRSTYSLIFDLNGHHLDYNSYSVINPEDWEGWSELNTNIEAIGVGHRVTIYKLQFSKDLSRPFSIVYEVLQDAVVEIKLDASLDIQLTRGFDLKIYFFLPSVNVEPFNIKSSLNAEIAGTQKSGKFVASYADGKKNYNIGLDGKLTEKDFAFIAKTNIGKVTEVKGKVGWSSEQNKTKVNVMLMLNGAKVLQGSVAFDRSPFTRMVISLQKDESTKQEIEIRWTQGKRANDRYQLLVTGKGVIESRLETTFAMTETSAQLDVSVTAVNTPFGSYDAAVSTIVRFGRGVYDLEINVQNNRENRQRKFKAGVNIQSPMVAAVEIRATSLPFDLPSFQITLDYDLSSDLKSLKADFNTATLKYNLEAKANWSPESSVINVVAMRSGGHKIVFKGERTGLTTMKYELDFMGTILKFESNNNIRSATDFDVSCKLSLPVYDEISMKASYSQYVMASQSHSFAGSIAIKQVGQP